MQRDGNATGASVSYQRFRSSWTSSARSSGRSWFRRSPESPSSGPMGGSTSTGVARGHSDAGSARGARRPHRQSGARGPARTADDRPAAGRRARGLRAL